MSMSANCKPDRYDQLQLNTIATRMTFRVSPWGMHVRCDWRRYISPGHPKLCLQINPL